MNEGGLRWNLCDPERVVKGLRFTCAAKSDSARTWACTGSEHLPVRGRVVEITCTCSCHDAKGSVVNYRLHLEALDK